MERVCNVYLRDEVILNFKDHNFGVGQKMLKGYNILLYRDFIVILKSNRNVDQNIIIPMSNIASLEVENEGDIDEFFRDKK
jgi:hypothetical protein